MASGRTHVGQLFAAAGAGVLVLALFMPWYDLNLSALGGNALGQGLGEFGTALQASLAHAGPVSLTGWQALGTLDVVLAALAAAVVAGVAMSANGGVAARPDGAIAIAGAASPRCSFSTA